MLSRPCLYIKIFIVYPRFPAVDLHRLDSLRISKPFAIHIHCDVVSKRLNRKQTLRNLVSRNVLLYT